MSNINKELLKILDIISVTSGIEKSQLSESTPIGVFGINSVTFISIIVKIEQELNIEIDDEDLEIKKYNTVADLLAVLGKKLNTDSSD